ncbi:hypothetical protein EJB05_42175 [Eragrostis curvula]|uniref:Protein kinase domain-containing protein n=1 Tax=Eragrostis curvula TaxID=38414 RepID=A0A5J9TBJ8_9POAL|nr:hypothetical protein EJB05_42175 [Eragrostis curvula]
MEITVILYVATCIGNNQQVCKLQHESSSNIYAGTALQIRWASLPGRSKQKGGRLALNFQKLLHDNRKGKRAAGNFPALQTAYPQLMANAGALGPYAKSLGFGIELDSRHYQFVMSIRPIASNSPSLQGFLRSVTRGLECETQTSLCSLGSKQAEEWRNRKGKKRNPSSAQVVKSGKRGRHTAAHASTLSLPPLTAVTSPPDLPLPSLDRRHPKPKPNQTPPPSTRSSRQLISSPRTDPSAPASSACLLVWSRPAAPPGGSSEPAAVPSQVTPLPLYACVAVVWCSRGVALWLCAGRHRAEQSQKKSKCSAGGFAAVSLMRHIVNMKMSVLSVRMRKKRHFGHFQYFCAIIIDISVMSDYVHCLLGNGFSPINDATKAPPPIEVPELSFEELKEKTDNFGSKALVGEGSYGRVYYAVLDSGKHVAVKKLDASTDPELDNEFLTQVSVASKLKHENFVEMLGYCVEGNQRLVAYEFATMGSLHDILHGYLLLFIFLGTSFGDIAEIHMQIDWQLCRVSSVMTIFCLFHHLIQATPRLTEDTVKQCVDPRLKGEYPPKGVAKLAAVAALCVQYESEFRPSMSIVVKALSPLLQHKPQPPPAAAPDTTVPSNA